MDPLAQLLEDMAENPSELRQAAEECVLAYLTALGYDQKPKQLILERGLNFAPMPAHKIDEIDPASNSCTISIDFDNNDNSLLNANALAANSGEHYTVSCIV